MLGEKNTSKERLDFNIDFNTKKVIQLSQILDSKLDSKLKNQILNKEIIIANKKYIIDIDDKDCCDSISVIDKQ